MGAYVTEVQRLLASAIRRISKRREQQRNVVMALNVLYFKTDTDFRIKERRATDGLKIRGRFESNLIYPKLDLA